MIAYDRLSQIMPADIALANKALSVSLEQVGGIQTKTLPEFAATVSAVTTNKGLPLIDAQTTAVPPSVANYYANNLGKGSGVNKNIEIVDGLGTAIGWVSANALANTVTLINSINTSTLTACYTNMLNTVNGVYTEEVENPSPPPANLYAVVIPSGPGAGTYGNYTTPALAVNVAFNSGLIPAAQSIISGLVSTYPSQTANLNANWSNMGAQLSLETNTQANAKLVFGNLVANDQGSIYSLIFSLPSYGLQTQVGGTAQFFEAVANTDTQGGQAIVGVLRQGQNQEALNNAGILTNSNVPAEPATAPPQAQLSSAEYTVAQASALLIK